MELETPIMVTFIIINGKLANPCRRCTFHWVHEDIKNKSLPCWIGLNKGKYIFTFNSLWPSGSIRPSKLSHLGASNGLLPL